MACYPLISFYFTVCVLISEHISLTCISYHLTRLMSMLFQIADTWFTYLRMPGLNLVVDSG